jgi:serine/threonine protein kinase
VKLIDLGAASFPVVNPSDRAAQGGVHGSTGYLAPEARVGVALPASDVYSLGALYWECRTGTPLGHLAAHADVHRRQVDEATARLHGIEERWFLRRMLAWDAAERPTAAEVRRYMDTRLPLAAGRGLREWAPHWHGRPQADPGSAVPPAPWIPRDEPPSLTLPILDSVTQVQPMLVPPTPPGPPAVSRLAYVISGGASFAVALVALLVMVAIGGLTWRSAPGAVDAWILQLANPPIPEQPTTTTDPLLTPPPPELLWPAAFAPSPRDGSVRIPDPD